jgi:cation diffusion facilitator CzcD-associated flavoprotein CzcO
VTGAGTGGTLKGVGQVLQQEPPETQIVLCEPDNAPMLGSGIPQPREPDRSLTTSHPLFRPHLVQGWKPDFIPKLTEDALAAKLVDRVLPIDSGEAMRLSRALAQQEGIFTGISGDGAVAPVDVAAVVVGAGPAGLASAACLKKRGVEAVVLEAGPDLATSWRNHYTRLHLHTVKQHSALPGVDFPADVPRYPSREQVVAYLEQYAAHFGIAPRTGEAVRRISVADGARLAVDSTRTRYRAPVVVMATGTNRVPNPDRLPEQDRFRGQLLHAGRYRDGAPFAGQRVLVIGAGNTGAEIALDLCERGATPTLSVRTPVNVVPRDFLGIPMQVTSIRLRKLPLALADRIGRIVSRMTFGDLTRQGLLRPALGPLSSIKLRGRIPLIDVGTIAAIKRGAITVKPALARFTEDGAQFSDGSSAPFDAAILATGYRPGLGDLVDVPGALDDAGRPRHWKASDAHPGLYFVGYADVSTGLLREIGLQAEAVAAAIVGS